MQGLWGARGSAGANLSLWNGDVGENWLQQEAELWLCWPLCCHWLVSRRSQWGWLQGGRRLGKASFITREVWDPAGEPEGPRVGFGMPWCLCETCRGTLNGAGDVESKQEGTLGCLICLTEISRRNSYKLKRFTRKSVQFSSCLEKKNLQPIKRKSSNSLRASYTRLSFHRASWQMESIAFFVLSKEIPALHTPVSGTIPPKGIWICVQAEWWWLKYSMWFLVRRMWDWVSLEVISSLVLRSALLLPQGWAPALMCPCLVLRALWLGWQGRMELQGMGGREYILYQQIVLDTCIYCELPLLLLFLPKPWDLSIMFLYGFRNQSVW